MVFIHKPFMKRLIFPKVTRGVLIFHLSAHQCVIRNKPGVFFGLKMPYPTVRFINSNMLFLDLKKHLMNKQECLRSAIAKCGPGFFPNDPIRRKALTFLKRFDSGLCLFAKAAINGARIITGSL